MSSLRLEPSEDVIFHALNNELVLLNLKTQQYFALNDIGTDMWNRLVEYGDLETVARLLSAEYEVDLETLRKDLQNLVGRLQAAGLLKTGDACAQGSNK